MQISKKLKAERNMFLCILNLQDNTAIFLRIFFFVLLKLIDKILLYKSSVGHLMIEHYPMIYQMIDHEVWGQGEPALQLVVCASKALNHDLLD